MLPALQVSAQNHAAPARAMHKQQAGLYASSCLVKRAHNVSCKGRCVHVYGGLLLAWTRGIRASCLMLRVAGRLCR
jgi:hypothetical protein